MENITLGLIQMKMENNPSKNLEKALSMVDRAASMGSDIVCLPELFMTKYFPAQRKGKIKIPESYLEQIPGNTTKLLSESAMENKITLIGGSIWEKSKGKRFNTSTIFDETGKMIGIYRKMHIPHDDHFYEQDYFEKGDLGFKTFQTKLAKIGVLICYDQWFPEAARINALMGAQIIFYPTAIGTVKGITQAEGSWQEAWENVMRGHAIANNIIVAGVNRAGVEGNTTFFGGSFVCNAFGKTIARAKGSEEILIAKMDLKHSKMVREGWRFFQNRRTDAYSDLLK